MLTEKQHADREGKITASRAVCLVSGDPVKILNLWKELIGDPSYEPEDFSDNLPVQIGEATEKPVNLPWFTKKHGPISRIGEVVTHSCGWAACTLDAWSEQHDCPVEAKHVGGRESIETVIDRYQPQLHWQMIVTGSNKAALSVLVSNNQHVVEFIERDESYAKMLFSRAEQFWQCVVTMTPPVVLPSAAAPERPTKIYQMQTNNLWAAQANVWLTNKDAAVAAKDAEKEIKALVPADAVQALGHGIIVKRDRAGKLSLREHMS